MYDKYEPETILKELREISEKVKALNYTDAMPGTLQTNLLELSSYKARVNDIKPELQYLYDTKLGEVSENPKKLSATLYKDWKDSQMRNERRLLEYCDRISSTIERCSENVRSVLSSVKAEMFGTQYGNADYERDY